MARWKIMSVPYAVSVAYYAGNANCVTPATLIHIYINLYVHSKSLGLDQHFKTDLLSIFH